VNWWEGRRERREVEDGSQHLVVPRSVLPQENNVFPSGMRKRNESESEE
jgi:hypothetical protein